MSDQNPLTEEYGKCPHCSTPSSRIVYGWHGVYYDMKCAAGHKWTYDFPEPEALRPASGYDGGAPGWSGI